jgi:hypothetical protein
VLDRTGQRLALIEELGENWDSYGARAPDAGAAATTRALVARACGDAGDAPYAVAPLVDGRVQVEWRGPGGAVEVEIGSDAHHAPAGRYS